MSRQSKARREDKRRKEQRRRVRHDHHRAALGDLGFLVAAMVADGVEAAVDRRSADLAEVVAALTEAAALGFAARVTGELSLVVTDLVAGAFRGGWQPAELVRQAGRRHRDDCRELVVAALRAPRTWRDARGAPAPAAWAEQLAGVGAGAPGAGADDCVAAWAAARRAGVGEAVRVALDAVGVLGRLHHIQVLAPPPSEWRNQGHRAAGRCDDPVLARVRALLAKAESTSFPAEAEALSAKAQELMARHAIDAAVARAAGAAPSETPTARRIPVDDPYAEAKSALCRAVAGANAVRTVWYGELAMTALVGFAADIDAVEALFTSLLVQASRAMLAGGAHTDATGRSRTRSWRQSFLIAYAGRIAERLAAAAATARHQAGDEHGAALVPILAGRDEAVDTELGRLFPHLRTTSGPSVTNAQGWQAGRTAAELAQLGPEQALTG